MEFYFISSILIFAFSPYSVQAASEVMVNVHQLPVFKNPTWQSKVIATFSKGEIIQIKENLDELASWKQNYDLTTYLESSAYSTTSPSPDNAGVRQLKKENKFYTILTSDGKIGHIPQEYVLPIYEDTRELNTHSTLHHDPTDYRDNYKIHTHSPFKRDEFLRSHLSFLTGPGHIENYLDGINGQSDSIAYGFQVSLQYAELTPTVDIGFFTQFKQNEGKVLSQNKVQSFSFKEFSLGPILTKKMWEAPMAQFSLDFGVLCSPKTKTTLQFEQETSTFYSLTLSPLLGIKVLTMPIAEHHQFSIGFQFYTPLRIYHKRQFNDERDILKAKSFDSQALLSYIATY